MATEYRTLDDFPGYRIGSDGTIWSCRLYQKNRMSSDWKLRKTERRYTGHLWIILIHKSGRHVSRSVHGLVLEAFIGPRPPGMECRHFPDASPANNSLSNLQWCTRQQNLMDRVAHGTMVRGVVHPRAKLTDADVRLVRMLFKGGASQHSIAIKAGVTQATIHAIVTGKTWKHIA